MELLDGATIAYDERRALECHAVISPSEPTPFNFLEYFDEAKARELALDCSRIVVQTVLGWREKPIEQALDFSNAPLVYRFVADQLGMEPYGKLFYVEDYTGPGSDNSGITEYASLRSIVMKSKIFQDFSGYERSEELNLVGNGLRVESVAAHELAHLAGAQDVVYFSIDQDTPRLVTSIMVPGTTLEDRSAKKGKYFEEGLGSLVGSMYLLERSTKFQQWSATEPFKSPEGTLLHVPKRLKFIGHHEYVFCAWGIERLVAVEPKVWDVLSASRKYGARSSAIRAELKSLVDGIDSGLFAFVDSTDIDDLDSIMETTECIDYLACKMLS